MSRSGSSPTFGVVIPARFASQRLPGKPLRDLGGKPMIVRVLENARQSAAGWVVVATDDQRIADAVTAAGGEAVLTSPEHASGTDRLAEVARRKELAPETIVVNVQGDEPLLDPKYVELVARALEANPSAGIATLATPIRDPGVIANPNVVKVVSDRSGMALYFSRAPLPWQGEALRHVGLYAYRARTLAELSAQPPVMLETAERLEQLRALWLGIPIHVSVVADPPGHGVDTEEDLERARAHFEAS
jgi:3-deoxy-manno-octulosonate cytidylyltransferase (CMP-KDO synthetase)